MSLKESLSGKLREVVLSAALFTGAGGLSCLTIDDSLAMTDQQKQSVETLKDANNNKTIDAWKRAKALAEIIKSPKIDNKRLVPKIVLHDSKGEPLSIRDVVDTNKVGMNNAKVLVNVAMMVPKGTMQHFKGSAYEEKLNKLHAALYQKLLDNKETTGPHIDMLVVAEHENGDMLVDAAKYKAPAKDAVVFLIGDSIPIIEYSVKEAARTFDIISEAEFHYTSDDTRDNDEEKTVGVSAEVDDATL